MWYGKKLSNASGRGAQGLEVAVLEQDLTGEGKGGKERQLGSEDRAESWGTANETEKEQPGDRRENRRKWCPESQVEKALQGGGSEKLC